MSSNLKDEYHLKLRNAFIDALVLGIHAPLDELDAALKNRKSSFKIEPKPIMNGLEEILKNPEKDLRDAHKIIEDAGTRDLEIINIPIENERNRRNPYRDDHLKLIEATRNAIKIVKKDKKLWYGGRAYTPKANVKHLGGFSLAGTFLFAAMVVCVDIFDKSAPSISTDGFIMPCLIGAVIGAISAVKYNNGYHKLAKNGFTLIRKQFKPS